MGDDVEQALVVAVETRLDGRADDDGADETAVGQARAFLSSSGERTSVRNVPEISSPLKATDSPFPAFRCATNVGE